MFIIVKYGDNRTLVCNPTCSVVNLLDSIKARAGYSARAISLDLADETGLIKDLDSHRHDAAMKHLDEKSTYILVEKMSSDNDDADSAADGVHYVFTPLLDNCTELFPNYTLRLSEDQRKLKVGKSNAKSPSPAGKMATKSTKKAPSAAPPLSRSGSRTKK